MTDAELLEYASEFRGGILDGESSHMMCYAVCAPLQSILKLMGMSCRLRELQFPEMNHWVIEFADGTVLDPTADQFGGDEVYVGPMPERYIDWESSELEPVNGETVK